MTSLRPSSLRPPSKKKLSSSNQLSLPKNPSSSNQSSPNKSPKPSPPTKPLSPNKSPKPSPPTKQLSPNKSPKPSPPKPLSPPKPFSPKLKPLSQKSVQNNISRCKENIKSDPTLIELIKLLEILDNKPNKSNIVIKSIDKIKNSIRNFCNPKLNETEIDTLILELINK
jgi:hypothetical protein